MVLGFMYTRSWLIQLNIHTYKGEISYMYGKKNLLILVFSWALIHFIITLKAGVGRGKDIFNSV